VDAAQARAMAGAVESKLGRMQAALAEVGLYKQNPADP
jgi:hypothetical protein